MTEPRDRASEDALEPIDDDTVDVDETVGEDKERVDDADVDAIGDDLLDQAEADAIEAETGEIDDYEAAIREVSGEPGAAATAVAAERRGSARRSEAEAPARTPSPSEIAVHVREDVSKVFVVVTVAVFGLILLNGLLLGTGGLLRPLPTPTPTASPTPSASASASAGPSVAPSATSGPSPAAS